MNVNKIMTGTRQRISLQQCSTLLMLECYNEAIIKFNSQRGELRFFNSKYVNKKSQDCHLKTS